MKKVLFALILLGIIGAGLGYYMYNKPVESLSNSKSDVAINAAELLIAFESDENAANENYLDKIIEVKGEVFKVDVANGKTSVYLNADNDLSAIICQLDDKETKSPTIGQVLTIKGLCTGYLTDVVLVRSVIL